MVYVLLIQSIALCQYLEHKRITYSIIIANINIGRLRKIIWFLSIPGIATMIFSSIRQAGFGSLCYHFLLGWRVGGGRVTLLFY